MIINIRDCIVNVRDVRTECDIAVANEVIKGDCYKLNIVKTIIEKPKVIIDVGGHIGTFGILAKSIWKDALLLSFEPNKVSYDLYCENMKSNGHTNYHVYNRALSYSKEETYLLDGIDATGGGMMRTKEEAEKIIEKGKYNLFHSNVQTITLEEVMKEHNIKEIDLAKWDCEGGEIGAYRNMTQSTRNSMKNMIGEYHLSGYKVPFDEEFQPLFPELDFIIRDKKRPLDLFWAYNKKYNLTKEILNIR